MEIHLNKAKQAIEKGANIEAKDSNGEMPLHIASLYYGHESIIPLLLKTCIMI
jgi:ankyrin repeat protein